MRTCVCSCARILAASAAPGVACAAKLPEMIDFPAAAIFTIDQLVEQFGLPCPNYLKIDVPGLTDDILAGGERTLRRPELREVHVEARETSAGGRRIIDTLSRAGLIVGGSSSHGSADLTFVRAGS